MGKLTTHVLDTARGKPGAGIPVELYRLENGTGTLVAKATTNRDGRTDAPLLEGASLRSGTYQLVFRIGAYFAGEGFLDVVPIRFDDRGRRGALSRAAAVFAVGLYDLSEGAEK